LGDLRDWHGVLLQRHLEITAAKLFGMELEVNHHAVPDCFLPIGFDALDFYGEYVYTGWGPLDTWGVFVPIILSYEYVGGGYEVICVFFWVTDQTEDGANAYYDEHLTNTMTHDEMLTYLQTTQNRHTITLKRNPNGGFYYWAHILPPDLT